MVDEGSSARTLHLQGVEEVPDEDEIEQVSPVDRTGMCALAGPTRQAQLEAKADTRGVIGMAKGMIMARQQVSDDEAFDILSQASQRASEMAERMGRPADE